MEKIMKILFDTSVLVASVVEPHPMHNRAFPWLKRAKLKEFEMFVATHTLAELYAVLTTLPVIPKIAPQMAEYLIKNDIEAIARIIPLSSQDYISTIKNMTASGLKGGVIYDGLIITAANKSAVDAILTFNTNDFERLWAKDTIQIILP